MNQADEPSLRKTSPKASGLPGLIAICQRSSRPSFSIAGRRWSSSPTETPPQVTIRSLLSAARLSAARVASRRSGTMPRSSWTAAERFDQAAQGEAVRVVDRAGLERLARHRELVAGREQRDARPASDRSVAAPTDAAMPSACGDRRVPAARTRAPRSTSSPRRRIAWPARTVASMRTPPSTALHSSCMTTASAPGGTCAPVKIRAARARRERRADAAGGDPLADRQHRARRRRRRRRAAHSRPSRCCRPAERRSASGRRRRGRGRARRRSRASRRGRPPAPAMRARMRATRRRATSSGGRGAVWSFIAGHFRRCSAFSRAPSTGHRREAPRQVLEARPGAPAVARRCRSPRGWCR